MKAGGKGAHSTFCGRDYTPVFWSRVKKTSGCWLWGGSRTQYGYGQFGASMTTGPSNQRKVLVHRYSWELVNGPVPNGLSVLHRCDVRNCVNPAHLFLGTAKTNAQDRVAKGRIGTRYQPVNTLLHPHLSMRGKMGKSSSS